MSGTKRLKDVTEPSIHFWIGSLNFQYFLFQEQSFYQWARFKWSQHNSIERCVQSKICSKRTLHQIRENCKKCRQLHVRGLYSWSSVFNYSSDVRFLRDVLWRYLSNLEKIFGTWNIQSISGMLESNGLQTILDYPDDFKFDLVLHDYTIGPCVLPLIHKFKYPPLIATTAFDNPPYRIHWIGGHNYPAYSWVLQKIFCDFLLNSKSFQILTTFCLIMLRWTFGKGFTTQLWPSLIFCKRIF